MYFQAAFSGVRPSGGSIDQVSFPNNSISDSQNDCLQNIHQTSSQTTTFSDDHIHLLIRWALPRIVISIGGSPHCPQIIPHNLPLITNGENAVNQENTASSTSGNQFISQNLMGSTLSSFPKLHKEQVPSIRANYALSSTNPSTSVVNPNSSSTDLNVSLPVMQSQNFHINPSISSVYIPKSILSISKSPTPEKWTLALENEINSLISQNVFDPSPIDISTIDKKLLIPSRVIFDTRMNADGTINKYKARLVAQGNHQDDSTFFDTFADTASAKSINILLSIAAAEDLEMASIDVKTAFLYSPIKEIVYLKRPPGLSPNIMPAVVKLNKCLYGLRQAAHEWRNLLDKTLKSQGFSQFKTDACIYKISKIMNNNSETLFIGVFVDDILCLSKSQNLIQWFHREMSTQFSITIKLNVDSFLGMQISRNRISKTISLSQPGYISTLMEKFNIDINSSNSYPTCPMSSSDIIDPSPIYLSPLEQSLYMKIVGSVLFLSTRSRPDLSYVVNYLSLFMQKASHTHLNLCYKLLKYIWKTKSLPLTFNGNSGINFFVMVDSSYASHADRKSHYGFSIHMNQNSGSCITVSKKSKIIALSSTEAEYIGMFEASKLIMWLRQLLNELGYPPTSSTVLYEDNKSAIHIVQNGNDKGRTKHMDVRYHLLRDLVQDQIIKVEYMPTESMTADILTKPLDSKLFLKHQVSLLGHLV
jgi:hypothetical protein